MAHLGLSIEIRFGTSLNHSKARRWQEVLRNHGKPEVFNSDQGSQFTSAAFTGVLKREGILISMDGRGRAFDNIFVERLWRSVKQEDVYLKGYAAMPELTIGLVNYFAFHNGERSHQSLGYKTPDVVYRTASGGGATIVDKYPRADEEESAEQSGKALTAKPKKSEKAARTKTKTEKKAKAKASIVKPGQRRPAASEVECAAQTEFNNCLDSGVHFTDHAPTPRRLYGFAGLECDTDEFFGRC